MGDLNMLKTRYRILAVILAILCLAPIFSFGSFASEAGEGDQAMYVEKYVSVLYDNSGSMLSDDRSYYANYAFQMMASMMNSGDTLWVVPMNKGGDVSKVEDAIEFEFTDDRGSDIKNFASKYLKDGKPLAPYNGAPTPLASMPVAVERLFKTDDIPDYNEGRDRKHWLVVLTDGRFTYKDGGSNPDHHIETTVGQMVEHLEANDKLNIIYVGMGSAADLSGATYVDVVDGNKVKQNVLQQRFAGRFTALMANTPEKVVSAMREVVNMMSDRYTLENKEADFITLSPDKKTATVKLSYVPFPLNSISYAVQNFGGELTKATYVGKTFTPENCIITPPSELGMKSGATGVIRDTDPNPILFNTSDTVGDLVLYFSEAVEEENIVLMAEPSLYIRSVFEYKDAGGNWVEGTRLDLMKKLQAGDKFRVGYRVYNGATGKPFTDLAGQLPGETYGTLYADGTMIADKLKGMSDEITLKVGSNKVKMSVSLMDGIYRLEENVDIRIVGSTAGYSMSGVYTAPTASEPFKSTSVFTPKKENAPMTKAELSTYTATVTVKNMEDVEVATGARAVLRDDGTYLVELDLSSQPFGEYTLKLTLSDTMSPVEMSAQTLPQYYPATVALVVDGASEISKTQNGFNRGQYRAFNFLLTADGKAFDFNNGLLSYELKFGNTVIDKDMYTVSGNKLSFVPDKDTVGALLSGSPSEYKITVSVSSTSHPHLKANAEATLRITETVLEVIVLKNEQLPIDRFDIQDTPAEIYFAVNCDDAYLTEEELAVALGQKEKDAATETVGKLTVESDWCDNALYPAKLSTPEITAITVNGETVPCFCVVVEPGHLGFFREHFTSWLIPKGDKPITVTYEVDGKSATAETAFVLATSGAWSYIWRLLVILLWIHLILCIVLNPTVPRHKSGYLVTLDLSGTASAAATVKSVKVINRTFMQKAIPLRWFIPFHPVVAQDKMGDNFVEFDFRHVGKKKNGKTEPLDKTKSKAVVLKPALIFSAGSLEGDAAASFKSYMNACKQQSHPTRSNMAPKNITNASLRTMFAAVVEHEDVSAASNYVPKKGVCNGFAGGDKILAFYTTKEAGGKVSFGKVNNVTFFVPKK